MADEQGSGRARLEIGVLTGIAEHGGHRTDFQVEKWDTDQLRWTLSRDYDGQRLIARDAEPDAADFARLGCKPFETYLKEDCNLITDVGWQNIMGGIAGTTPTKFVNATTGRIGLGTSATAVAYTDTALGAIGALTTANWKVINAVPTVGSTHTAGLILAAQFGTTEANNVAIQEFAADLGTASTLSTAAVGGLFSHGNATPGTKTSAQTWNATITYTWT
jgi:hypothetical protein